MEQMIITGAQFRDMVAVGASLLEKKRAGIDALNVFPVPDGDTGTNMCKTMQSAVKEIGKLSGTPTVSEVADAISMGALRGARGNSGVILSQLFRGFSKALKGASVMDAQLLSDALNKGTEAAYKAVMRPKEGTILSVARAISEAVAEEQQNGANVYKLIDIAVDAGYTALDKTPDQLPVLKETGVVDSGGKGLCTIYRGFKLYLDGEEVAEFEEETKPAAKPEEKMQATAVSDKEIEFGYCTEFFIIRLDSAFGEKDLESLRNHLMSMGDSVVAVQDGDIIKVHVHTNAPGKVLQMALRIGELDNLKIDNLREENRQIREERKKNEKESAVIAVSAGAGIDEVFKEMGTDCIVTGGQTMNPSTEDFVQAIHKVNARNVYILPNNGNIIMAAQQSAYLVDCKVHVIPTKTILQGITALMAFDPSGDAESNKSAMTEAILNVVSGSVTFAARKSTVRGKNIRKGDILGLLDNDLEITGSSIPSVTERLFAAMTVKKGSAFGNATIFYGEDVKEEEANSLMERLQKKFPDVEFAVMNGQQSLYYYYLSIE